MCLRLIDYTYVHYMPALQAFSQDYGPATHVVCVNFIREWRDPQFNVDSERQIFDYSQHKAYA